MGLGRDRDKAVRLAEEANIQHDIMSMEGMLAQLRSKMGSAHLLDATGLMSAAAIVRQSKPLRRRCSVYFLIKDGEVAYVGRSIDCDRRVASHLLRLGDAIERVFVLELQECDLEAMEALYIEKFKPRLNATYPSSNGATAWGRT